MILTEALQLLIVYLVDEDVPFIQTAHVTLRQLLSTPQGLAALQQLDPLQQSHIQIFAGPKRAAVLPEQGTRWQHPWRIYSEPRGHPRVLCNTSISSHGWT